MLRINRPLALAGLVVATGAGAAPRAQSELECGIAADMAVVARSLATERIDRAKANTIMARIYDVASSTRGKELMKEILDAAYARGSAAAGGSAADAAPAGSPQTNSPRNFAESLYTTCVSSGGDMDPVLGKKL